MRNLRGWRDVLSSSKLLAQVPENRVYFWQPHIYYIFITKYNIIHILNAIEPRVLGDCIANL